MKKIISICILLSLSLTLIFANGKNEEQTKTEEPLSVLIWDNNQEPGLTQIIDDFTTKTGIKAEIQVVNWENYWTLLSAGAQSGSLPDVFWMHSKASQKYMSNDMLLDLTDRINNSELIDLENYPDDIIDLYSYNNSNYAIPKDIDTIALWYNKTLFDEAGLAYPDESWTWEDLYENAKKLTNKDKGIYGYAIKNSDGQAGWYNMVYDNYGYIISEDKKKSGLDNPKTIESLQILQKIIDEGIMPSQEIMSESSVDVLFQSGKVAMSPFGSWMLAAFKSNDYTKNNCDLTVLPKNKNTGRRASIYNGLGWAISGNTKRAEDAWKLVEYFGSKEGQLKQAKLGVTMSAYKNTSTAWKEDVPYFNLQAYLDMQNDMVIYPHSKSAEKWEIAMNDCTREAWAKNITLEEACKQAAKLMNEIISEE